MENIMNDSATMTKPEFTKLDEGQANAFLRESAILNRSQSQSLADDEISAIRMGKQDQSLGKADFVYGLTHADQVWDQVNTVGHQST
jgi:hypothetical protein